LNQGPMSEVGSGKRTHHKGFKLRRVLRNQVIPTPTLPIPTPDWFSFAFEEYEEALAA